MNRDPGLLLSSVQGGLVNANSVNPFAPELTSFYCLLISIFASASRYSCSTFLGTLLGMSKTTL